MVPNTLAPADHYRQCLKDGCSPRLAELFATGQTPTLRTDSTFLEGRWNQFAKTPMQGDFYKSIAESEGVNVKGAVYMSGLAAYPGDPRAWVRGRGDVQKVCEERGWECTGSVNVKGRPVEASVGGIADDLVNDEVVSVLEGAANPREIDVVDLKEQVKAKRKPHWAK